MPMYVLTITATAPDEEALCSLVHAVASMMQQGFISGFDRVAPYPHHWELVEQGDEKEKEIPAPRIDPKLQGKGY